MTEALSKADLAARVVALAEQCVMCGICLPECPTYRIANDEAESPRGRIALAKAIANGSLVPTLLARQHLDQCLGCLSCEKACPSQVRYEDILVGIRACLRPGKESKRKDWLDDPIRLTKLATIGRALGTARWLPGLARLLLPKTSYARRVAVTQPRPAPALRIASQRTVRGRTKGRIGLFQGCVASVYDRDTLAATRFLLAACGHEVVSPAKTQCCGALARHRGDIASAATSAAATRGAFDTLDVDQVLVTASGCFGDLRDEVCAGSDVEVTDATAFLDADASFAELRFRPLRRNVALHSPCTQVNVVGAAAAITRLLARIPDLEIVPLPAQPRCCGAAGSYFLEHATIADRLRNEKLDQADALAPDMILTTNIGCRLHLDNGLRERASAIIVRHPLALLAEQLDTSRP